jgi:signal peptidase I
VSRTDDDDLGTGTGAAPRSSLTPPPSSSGVTPPPPSVDDTFASTSDDKAAGASSASKRKKKPLPLWQEVILLLVTAFVLALVVKTFLLQAFYIPSASMEPTLQINDKILVQKVSYWNDDVHRGDLVVFDDPGGWLRSGETTSPSNPVQRVLEVVGLYPSGGHLVKRVIAIGGDTVMCCDRGRVVVNGVALEEDFLPEGTVNHKYAEITVPEDRLWVLGDNRANSEDSHAHTGEPGGGFVAVDDVVGKVWAIVWPRQHLDIIDRPKVYDSPELDAASGG